MKPHLAVLVALPIVLAQSGAHAQSDPFKIPLRSDQLPTTWKALNQSLTDLLDSGYIIVSGISGSYVLHNSNAQRWVSCEISPPSFGNPAASHCMALN